MLEKNKIFSLLADPIQNAIRDRGFPGPTEPQKKAIPLILEGKNVLLISPTASGKTEAALLPTLSKFISNNKNVSGIKILYITPLRALNRDMLERVEWWCNLLDVKVAVRHGDTDTAERTRQSKDPPDMLITTPETLQAILTGRILKKHLQEVRFVIVDEVHELAENKRGSQLALALERLRWIIKKDFQLIGLSATIGTPEEVGSFLVGTDREVEIIKVSLARKTSLKILYPKPNPSDYRLSSKLYAHPDVTARLRVMRDLIENHQSIILFTNTRSLAEVLTSRFKVWDTDFPISIHHGSLSKPARISAEKGFKNGDLKALVATSSLELGLDIGSIDFVIQYMSPRQVTRLIQRIGRSGHSIGRLAEGTVLTMDADDTLEALVIAKRAYEEKLEPVMIPDKPFDVLTHQIVGLLMQKSKWMFDEILEIFRKAYPYRNLSKKELESVLIYMHSRFPRLAWISSEDQIILRPKITRALYHYYFGKLSMIPDQKQFLVIDESTDSPIGVLDEAFVAEYGGFNTKFIIRGSPWKMTMMSGDKIFARSIKDPTGAIPSWIGEEIPVPFEIAKEVGQIRASIEKGIEKGKDKKEIVDELAKIYPSDEITIQRAIEETLEQIMQGHPIPSDKQIIIEDVKDYIIINAHFGTSVNRTLARLLAHVLSEQVGHMVGIQQDPYRIIIQTDGFFNSDNVSRALADLANVKIEDLIKQASLKSGLFKRRMIQVAKRAGAISKRIKRSRGISLNRLLKSFEGTVILDEALKETYSKDLDLPNTLIILEEIKLGKIGIATIKARKGITPITRIGLERISRRTDLIPPEKIERILIEATEARILNEYKTIVCTNCWNQVKITQIKELPDRISCSKCSKPTIGMANESKETINKIIQKSKAHLSSKEKNLLENILETSNLIKEYGKVAACVLSGKRIEISDAYEILNQVSEISPDLFKLIMKAEKEALTKGFW